MRERRSTSGDLDWFGLGLSHRTLDDLRAFLKAEGQVWAEQEIQNGTHLKLPSGETASLGS